MYFMDTSLHLPTSIGFFTPQRYIKPQLRTPDLYNIQSLDDITLVRFTYNRYSSRLLELKVNIINSINYANFVFYLVY